MLILINITLYYIKACFNKRVLVSRVLSYNKIYIELQVNKTTIPTRDIKDYNIKERDFENIKRMLQYLNSILINTL